jgi:hypothetical protein
MLLKCILNKRGEKIELGSAGQEQGALRFSFEHGNENAVFRGKKMS